MNAIQYSLNHIKHTIPPSILDAMFKNTVARNFNWSRMHAPVLSVDHQIRDKVIDGRVLVDVNHFTGQRELINITGLSPVMESDFSHVLHIPKERTNNRSIVAAFTIVQGGQSGALAGTFNMSHGNATSTMGEALKAVNQSRSPIPVMGDANIAIISENTIAMRSPIRLSGVSWLDCMLEYNSQMSNVPPSAYRAFAKLAMYATQAYIYNNIIIPMDEAEIMGGMGLGQFRSIVEGYSDAEELYQEQLVIWENVSILSDPVQHLDHIQSLFPGLI